MGKKIIILALSGVGFNEVTGYMDDGSETYKRFVVNQNNEVYIQLVYPKESHGGRIKFAAMMGKLDPYTSFLREPPEVDKLDYYGLKELYEKHYETPYDGGFTVLKEDAGNVEIVWDGSERREIFSQEEFQDLKLHFKKAIKNHFRMK